MLMILVVSITCSAPSAQPVKAMGTIYIRADGSIDPPEAPVSSLDNITYTLTSTVTDSVVVERSNIIIDGATSTIQGDGTGNGFSLQEVLNVTIRNTTIQDCFDGIQLFNSSATIITGNTITGNSYEGIGVYYSSNNLIADNDITNNQIGIAFYNSSSTWIVHNSFVGNALQAYTESSPNIWSGSYPLGGNYWSDYNGSDTKCGPYQDHPGSDSTGDTPYSIDSTNMDGYPLLNPWTPPTGHNVAIISALSFKTVVAQGSTSNITVFGANKGEYTETLNITVHVGTNIIGPKAVLILSGSVGWVVFPWSTSGLPFGNYTLSAYTEAVPGETNSTDNSWFGGWVIVTIQGDVDGNFRVDMGDVVSILKAFGSTYGRPNYNPNCDFDSNLRIDMTDVITALRVFGQHYP
jgi:parallel beta-helix repeat protein